MAAQDRRPRRKVRSKTPVPAAPGRGSVTRERRRRSFDRLRTFGVPVLLLGLAIGLGVYLGVRSARSGDDTAVIATPTQTTPTTPPTTADAGPRPARVLFEETCSACHTLAAAGATGGIGPNLDEIRPDRARVQAAIQNGSLSGAMPANLLTGDDAERVAAYVSRNAGRP